MGICAATLGVIGVGVKTDHHSRKVTHDAKQIIKAKRGLPLAHVPSHPRMYTVANDCRSRNNKTGTFSMIRQRLFNFLAVFSTLALGACGGSGEGKTAYIGATVFDGSGAPPILDAIIVVSDGKIESIGPPDLVRVPRGALEMRLDGRWVIPGLIDSHAHVESWALNRFLAYGVTSVRGMGGPSEQVYSLRDSVSLGSLFGPRLYISGPMLDGSPATWPGALELTSTTAARRAAVDQVLAEASQIKVYSKIDRRLLEAILDEARDLLIPVAAHLGRVDAVTAAEMGVNSIEHMSGVVEASAADPGRFLRAHGDFFTGWNTAERAWSGLDSARLMRTATALAEAGVVIVPTLVLHEAYAHLSDDEFIARLDLTGIPRAIHAEWNVPGLVQRARLSSNDFRAFRRSRPVQDRFLRMFRSANGTIVAGTDAPNQLLAPGASLHDELRLLVAAGMSPRDALLAATRDAAALIGADSIGLLLPGNVADFVVLTGDPIANIRNTRNVDRIVFKGISYAPEEIRLEW